MTCVSNTIEAFAQHKKTFVTHFVYVMQESHAWKADTVNTFCSFIPLRVTDSLSSSQDVVLFWQLLYILSWQRLTGQYCHVAWNVECRVLSGTSMAAPHIAGIAALYLEAYPSAAAYQVHHLPFLLPSTLPFETPIVCPGSSPTVGPSLYLHVQKHTRQLTLILSAQPFIMLTCQYPECTASPVQSASLAAYTASV